MQIPLRPRQWARLQALLGGAFLVTFVLFALRARFDAPYRDDWDWVWHQLAGAGLLAPHNEHVIPLARLLSRWQFQWGGLTGTLIQNVALFCHAISVGLFWMEIRRAWPHRPAWRSGAIGLMLVCLGFNYQLQSVVFGAAILFPLVQAWTMLAVVAALQASEPGHSGPGRSGHGRWWLATVVACVGAVASMTTGAVAPVIVAGIAWGRGASWRVVCAFGALGGVFVAAYVILHGLDPEIVPGDSGALGWPARIVAVVAYVPAVFGGVVTSASATLGIVAGSVVVALMAAAAVDVARRRARASRLEWFSAAMIVFAGISALAAALGRIQFGVAQAAQSRYATFVLAAVAALVMIGMSRLERSGRLVPVRARLPAVAVATSALLLLAHLYLGALWVVKADNIAAAYVSVRAGVPDIAWLTTLHPTPEVVMRVLDRLTAGGVRVVDAGLLQPVTVPAGLPACGGGWILQRHGRHGELRLTGSTRDAGVTVANGLIVDRLDTQVGVSVPAPLVAVPNPPASAVNAAVRGWLLGNRDATGAWIGFAQGGDGPPYRWLGRDRAGLWVCAQPLEVVPVTHMVLDVVRPDAADGMVAIGWGFACGSAVSSWALTIDGAPMPAQVTTGIPRPDVEQALRLECAPDAPPGVHLRFEASGLAPGRHSATLHVSTASGHRAESAPLEFRR